MQNYREGDNQNITEFPSELSQDFHGNQEWKYSELTKFGLKVYQNLERYQYVFFKELSNGDGEKRKVLIEFLMLMVENDYINCGTSTIERMIVKLIQAINKKNADCPELQLLSLLMAAQSRVNYFLDNCASAYRQQSPDAANICLWIMQKILSKADGLVEKKIKGPSMTVTQINKFCSMAFDIVIVLSSHEFINNKDRQNFILIASHSLRLFSKYIHSDNSFTQLPNLQHFHCIWLSIIQSNLQKINYQTANAALGVMIELFNYPNSNIISYIQEPNMFLQLTIFLQRFTLRCENGNLLWKTYLSKKNNIKNFETIEGTSLMKHFCYFLQTLTDDLRQIGNKFAVVDNMLILSKIVSKSYAHDQVRKPLSSHLNPENQEQYSKVLKFLSIGLQALYYPIFKITPNNQILLKAIAEMKKISNLEQLHDNSLTLEIKHSTLNLLPILKIILHKDSSIVSHQVGLLDGMIHFILMLTLDKNDGHYFQEFIQIICKQLNAQFAKKAKSNYHQVFSNFIHSLIIKQIESLYYYLVKNGRTIHIGNYLACMSKLIDVNITTKFDNIVYLDKFLDILELKVNAMDHSLYKILQKLINQAKGPSWQIEKVFKKLFAILKVNNTFFYTELLFDFAEKHKSIYNLMKNHLNDIRDLCESCPHVSQSIRHINYSIMVQSLNESTENKQIIRDLSNIAHKQYFTPKTYLQLIQSIKKQRNVLEQLLKKIYYNEAIANSLYEILELMIVMLKKVVNTFSQFSVLNKIQRAEICKVISEEILCYTQIIIVYSPPAGILINCKQITKQIFQFVAANHGIRMKPFECVIKNLVTSYLQLQIKARRQSKEQQYKNQNNGQIQYFDNEYNVIKRIFTIFHLNPDEDGYDLPNPQQHLLISGNVLKFYMMHNEVNQNVDLGGINKA